MHKGCKTTSQTLPLLSVKNPPYSSYTTILSSLVFLMPPCHVMENGLCDLSLPTIDT